MAAAEQQLDSWMSSMQQELAGIRIEFSQQRIFGVFIINNAKQVRAHPQVLQGHSQAPISCVKLTAMRVQAAP